MRPALVALLVTCACSDRPLQLPEAPPSPDGSVADASISHEPDLSRPVFDQSVSDTGDGDLARPDAAAPLDGGDNPTLLAACGFVPVSFDDWERCYQKRECEWRVGCVTGNRYRDVQECIDLGDAVEGGRLAAELRARKRAIDEGRASIDVAAFTTCVLETSEALCDTALFNPSCLTRFTGTIADGGDCYTDIECVSPGATCKPTCAGACCLGSCQPKFKEGEGCQDFDSCEPGLECNGTLCVAGDIGTPCTSEWDCDGDAWCDVPAGLCKATLAPGAVCTSLLQCGGETTCLGLSIVNANPGRCLSISKPGDSCESYCFGNLYCDFSRTCRAQLALGDDCSYFPCGGVTTMCKSHRCVLRDDVGVACTAQSCLPGLFCTSVLMDPNPICAARGGEGQPCADPSHCQSYLCSGSAGQPGICLARSDSCP